MPTVKQLIADFRAAYPDPSADGVDVEAMTAAALAIKQAHAADQAATVVADVEGFIAEAETAAADEVQAAEPEASETAACAPKKEDVTASAETEAGTTEAPAAAEPVVAVTEFRKEVETAEDGTVQTKVKAQSTAPPVSETEVEKTEVQETETEAPSEEAPAQAPAPEEAEKKEDETEQVKASTDTPAEAPAETVTASITTAKETADMPVTQAPESTATENAVTAAITEQLYYNGQPTTDNGIADAIMAGLKSYNVSTLAHGSQVRFDVGSVVRQGRMLDTDSAVDLDVLLADITNERNLGSPDGTLLTAAGGWCAMSTEVTTNDVLADRSGLVNIPTFGVRAGIRFQRMPEYWSVFNAIRAVYTEEQDEAGNYGLDANGIGNDTAGLKKVYVVPCSDIEELRLKTKPFIIQAGLLMMRAMPQRISGVVNMARIAHAHWGDSLILRDIIAGSTEVVIPAQAGVAAGLLDKIELHARSIQQQLRTSRTVEAILPDWTPGIVRADLSRRLGVDMLSVTDAQITKWFSDRRIRVQYSANLAPLPTAAATLTAWPTEIPVIVYPAGTWAVGVQDVANISMVYDQANLVNNDATVLFFEDAYLTFRRGPDASRYLRVSVCPDGSTHGGIGIECNGTATP